MLSAWLAPPPASEFDKLIRSGISKLDHRESQVARTMRKYPVVPTDLAKLQPATHCTMYKCSAFDTTYYTVYYYSKENKLATIQLWFPIDMRDHLKGLLNGLYRASDVSWDYPRHHKGKYAPYMVSMAYRSSFCVLTLTRITVLVD